MEDVEDGPLEPAYENDLDIAQETIGAVMKILRQQSLEVEKRRCTDFTYCTVFQDTGCSIRWYTGDGINLSFLWEKAYVHTSSNDK